MARPGRPERNRAAQSFRQLRRFHHAINSDEVFGTHRAACIAPNAEKFDNQKPWAASFLFVRRGTQSYDEFIAAVPLLAWPEHDARDDQHVRHFLDWRKRKCVYLVGSQVT